MLLLGEVMIAIFPKVISAAEVRDVEALSVIVRKSYLYKKAGFPKVDMYNLIKSVGIDFSELQHGALASLGAKDQKGRFQVGVLVDPSRRPEKSIVLGVLLGYYFFEVQPRIAKNEYKGEGYSIASLPALMQEYESNQLSPNLRLATEFSLALHMPKGMFMKAQLKLDHLEALAGFFGCPTQAINARLEMLRKEQAGFKKADASLVRKKLTRNPEPANLQKPITDEQKQLISKLAKQNGYKQEQGNGTADLSSSSVLAADGSAKSNAVDAVHQSENPKQALMMLRKLAKTLDDSVEI